MAVKIYKYPVPGRVNAPVRRWLQPHLQDGRMMMWAELDEDLPEQSWAIVPVGTGWEMTGEDAEFMRKGVYCGTVIDDPHVWHIYACKMGKGDDVSWS